MAVVNLTACFRFSRFITDNTINFRHISASSLNITPFGKFSWTGRKFTATTSENTQDKPTEGVEVAEKIQDSEKLKTDIENLNKELETLNETLVSLEDKYKRSLAENENLRVRLTKQVEDAKLFGIQSFCKDLIEPNHFMLESICKLSKESLTECQNLKISEKETVSDILEKATASVPKEEITERNPHLKNLYEGLTMTEAELQRLFKKHGLLSVNPLNEKFDPNLHEALFQKEVEGKEPGTVVVVTKIGYKLHERVIRPALVGVAKSPS